MTSLIAPSSAPTNGHAGAGSHAGLESLPVLSQLPTASTSTTAPRVLIVGGGPAGLVSLRNLTEDESQQGGKEGFDAVLYERREKIGGVW